MDPHLDEHISIHLSKAACLVLFELLTTSYEQWIEKNSDDSSASPMLVNAAEHEQRVALWHPEGALERTIPEIFSANYADLVKSSKKLLSKDL